MEHRDNLLEKDNQIVKLQGQCYKLKLNRQDRRLLKYEGKRKFKKFRERILKELDIDMFSDTSETDDS